MGTRRLQYQAIKNKIEATWQTTETCLSLTIQEMQKVLAPLREIGNLSQL